MKKIFLNLFVSMLSLTSLTVTTQINSMYDVPIKFHCYTCWDEKTQNEMYATSCCNFPLCHDCWNTLLDSALSDINLLNCPNVDCPKKRPRISVAQLDRMAASFANQAVVDRLKRMLSKTSDSNVKGEKFVSKLKTEAWKYFKTKKCPNCKSHIEKNNGCKHMTCRECKHQFCWICLGNWERHDNSYCLTISPFKVLGIGKKSTISMGIIYYCIKKRDSLKTKLIQIKNKVSEGTKKFVKKCNQVKEFVADCI